MLPSPTAKTRRGRALGWPAAAQGREGGAHSCPPARTRCSSLWRRRCGCGLGEESGVLPAPTSPPNANLVLTSGGRPCHAAPCRPGRDSPRQRSSRGSACASRAASNAGKRHRRVSCGRASGRSGGLDPASAVAGQRGASEASDRARSDSLGGGWCRGNLKQQRHRTPRSPLRGRPAAPSRLPLGGACVHSLGAVGKGCGKDGVRCGAPRRPAALTSRGEGAGPSGGAARTRMRERRCDANTATGGAGDLRPGPRFQSTGPDPLPGRTADP